MTIRHSLLAAAGRYSPPVTADPQFNYVSLLLHGDGTNGAQNNTFLDSSTNNFTITRNGNTTQGSLSPYGNLWSNYFDGNGDFLQTPTSTALNFNSVDYTAEAWVYLNMGTYSSFDQAGRGILSDYLSNSYSRWMLSIDSGGKLSFAEQDASGQVPVAITDTVNMPLNQWVHTAICKSGTTMYLFKNGVLVGTATSPVRTNFGGRLNVGQVTVDTSYRGYFLGYISNARALKGTALYTSNFTPSTTPLTAVSGTSLLTCQSNRFIDNSANNFTITRNGDVQVTKEAPFLPTAAYSTSVIGGSGYFDGAGDWLQIADSTALQVGSNDFCIECWICPTAMPAAGTVARFMTKNTGEPTGYEWTFGITPSGQLQFVFYTINTVAVTSSSGLIAANSGWYHVAFCRSGTTFGLFCNGVRQGGTVASRAILSTTSPVAIGRDLETTGREFTGYICDARIVNGSSVYDPSSGATLTVPTAPLTAITYTSLLLKFTNAGIFDNAGQNDLETVGNAQISTSVKKYGTGSIYLNGGPYLALAATSGMALGTSDFTIEAWVYPLSNNFEVIDFRPNSTNGAYPAIYCDYGTFGYHVNNTFQIYGGTVTLNAWQHIAVVRKNGTTTMYLNGVSVGSFSDGWNYLVGAGRPVIGVNGYATYVNAMNGYIDDLRITKGYARYSANFTPPTAALPDK